MPSNAGSQVSEKTPKKAPARVALTSRDMLLLLTLVKARILDCDQIMAICGFTTVRRANGRLLQLHQAGYLRRWFFATKAGGLKALYGLSAKGVIATGQSPARLLSWKQNELISGNEFVSHQQAVNDILIQVRFRPLPPGIGCREWLTFASPISSAIPLAPDAYFELERDSSVYPMFLELDRGTETLKVWRKKVELYIDLAVTGESERIFRQSRFRVLVLTLSERRLNSIRQTVLRQTDDLFWFSTLPMINKEGIWGSQWSRPAGGPATTLL